MKVFLRVLSYGKKYKSQIILSIVCALLVAFLFSLNLAAVLPLMKVLLEEEGVHGWVYREIIEDRTGLHMTMVKPDDAKAAGDSDDDWQPNQLLILKIEPDSPAKKSGFRFHEGDKLVFHAGDSIELNAELHKLATSTRQRNTLRIRRLNDSEEDLELSLNSEPFYAGIAYQALKLLPAQQSKDFVRQALTSLIIFILIITLLRCFLRFVQEYLVRRIAYRVLMHIRLDTFQTVVRLPLSFYNEQGISDTLSRFVQDSNRIHRGITLVLGKAIREPLKIIMLLVLSFMIDPTMTIIVLIAAPFGAWVIGLIGKKMKKATHRTLENWAKVLGRLKDSLMGIRVIKAYHREEFEEHSFQEISLRLLKQQFRMAKVEAASGPILESLGMIAACIGMAFAVQWITGSQTTMSVSEFSAIVLLLGAMATIGRNMGNIVTNYNVAVAAAERIFGLVDNIYETDPDNAITLEPLSQSLEFRDVSFTYPNSPQPTLANINLNVKAGQTVAIVGPNGSGKTTLLGLIPKFFNPDQGQILMDGQDIASASLASLRQQIGIITQQTIVFNDTIYANIAYGDPEADRESVIAAAKKAYAHEFIEQTEAGYETIVGEQGATLSGGQLQRLAIARAILRSPAILIFDEATSQIDSDSEIKIHQAITEFSRNRTSFVIAHRLNTIVDADLIVVLDKGQVIAQGDHKTLINQCPTYSQLYQAQFSEMNN